MIRPSTSTARKRRAEAKVIKAIREQVATRDGFCRAAMKRVGPCQGVSEWAHYLKRFQTRKQAPEMRHTTGGSLMLCTRHHRAFDEHRLQIEVLTAAGCDGPLAFRSEGVSYEESVA